MRQIIQVVCLALLSMVLSTVSASAQQQQAAPPATASSAGQNEVRVPLTEQPVALDAKGGTALAARLRVTTLNGTADAPVRNTRLVIENRSQFFYTYVSGWVTFYDADGIRCGEGLFKLDALSPGESAETDTPGLRLACSPSSWRIAANNLLTRTTDIAKPGETAPATNTASPSAPSKTTLPPLTININGQTLPVQAGNPIEIKVGKENVRIVLDVAP